MLSHADNDDGSFFYDFIVGCDCKGRNSHTHTPRALTAFHLPLPIIIFLSFLSSFLPKLWHNNSSVFFSSLRSLFFILVWIETIFGWRGNVTLRLRMLRVATSHRKWMWIWCVGWLCCLVGGFYGRANKLKIVVLLTNYEKTWFSLEDRRQSSTKSTAPKSIPKRVHSRFDFDGMTKLWYGNSRRTSRTATIHQIALLFTYTKIHGAK